MMLGLCLLVIGCAQSIQPKDPVPVFPVTGNLIHQGQPMAGAIITFHSTERALTAQGTADDSGVYSLTTYVTNDGAAAGEYTVTVHWPSSAPIAPTAEDPDPPLPPDRLKSAYTNTKTSKLQATVDQQSNSIDFEFP